MALVDGMLKRIEETYSTAVDYGPTFYRTAILYDLSYTFFPSTFQRTIYV